MVTWRYDMPVPDDVPDSELDGYRQVAVELWGTSTEMMGAHGQAPEVSLVELDEPGFEVDKVTGDVVPAPKRVWRVEGEAL